MIHREVYGTVYNRLVHFDSVILLGPRQVGKTTLAHQIASNWQSGAKYLDLEDLEDRQLLDDPKAYLSRQADKLVVLDEIHRKPELFEVLRGIIDQRRRDRNHTGKFLLLGSASLDLMRQSSESLAGRISYAELSPFSINEVATSDQSVDVEFQSNLDELWLRGGFPRSYLGNSEKLSLQWRIDFIKTYLERDLPQFGLQVVTDQMERFWRMIANDQGELFNAQRYARSLGVDGKTIFRYLDILHRLLMVRLLKPWYADTGKRLVKAPRPYVRDSGVLHALLNLKTTDSLLSHPVVGKSWEGFVIENLINATNGQAMPYFYRTGAGAEINLVLEFSPGKCWAIEIKLSSTPTVDRGFYTASQDIEAIRRIVVYKGKERFSMRHNVEAMPLLEATQEIRAAVV